MRKDFEMSEKPLSGKSNRFFNAESTEINSP